MTISKLGEIRDKNRDLVLVRKLAAADSEKLEQKTAYRKQVLVCGGTGCTSSGSKKVLKALKKELEKQGVDDVLVVRTGCFGLCSLGPIMIVYPEGSFYSKVTAQEIPEIVSGHLKKGGKPINKYLYPETVHKDGSTIPLAETPFYKKQMRIALRNCGMIDPENIDEAIGANAYQALAKVLTQMTPQQACAAGAAQVSPRGANGLLPWRRKTIPNTFAAMPMKAIPARLWTAPCWRATRMPL